MGSPRAWGRVNLPWMKTPPLLDLLSHRWTLLGLLLLSILIWGAGPFHLLGGALVFARFRAASTHAPQLDPPLSLKRLLGWSVLGGGAIGVMLVTLYVLTRDGPALAHDILFDGVRWLLGGLSLGALAGLARGALVWRRWRQVLPPELGRLRLRGGEIILEIPLHHAPALRPRPRSRRRHRVAGLGDPLFDARFILTRLDQGGLAYLCRPALRAQLVALREAPTLRWSKQRVRAPLGAFGGDVASISEAIARLSPLRDAQAPSAPDEALCQHLRDEEREADVALKGLAALSEDRREAAIAGLWPRLDLYAQARIAALSHPGRRARLLEVFNATGPETGPARAAALDALINAHEPHERLLEDLDDDQEEVRAVALRRLVEIGYRLSPSGLTWCLARGAVSPSLDDTLLRMAEDAWHTPLAQYTRARLGSHRAPTRARAITLLGRWDEDTAALREAMKAAPFGEQRHIKQAIRQIRARRADGAGALTLSPARGELSLSNEAGGLSALREREL